MMAFTALVLCKLHKSQLENNTSVLYNPHHIIGGAVVLNYTWHCWIN